MPRPLFALVFGALLLLPLIAAPRPATADLAKDLLKALDLCKTITVPTLKDDCVSNAHHRYGKGRSDLKSLGKTVEKLGKKGGKGKGKK